MGSRGGFWKEESHLRARGRNVRLWRDLARDGHLGLGKSNGNVGAQDIQVPRSEQGKGSGKTGLGSKGQEGLKVLPVPLGWGLTLGRGSTILRIFAVWSRLGPWRSYAIRHNEPPVTGLLEGSSQLFPLVRCVFSTFSIPLGAVAFPSSPDSTIPSALGLAWFVPLVPGAIPLFHLQSP